MNEEIKLSVGEITLFQRTCWYRFTTDAAGVPVLTLEGVRGRIAVYHGEEAESASRRLEWWRKRCGKVNVNVDVDVKGTRKKSLKKLSIPEGQYR